MNAVARAVLALAPTCLLLLASLLIFRRCRDASSLFQVLGAGGAVTVVLTHVIEALHIFPWMQWGQEGSIGHYVDLLSAMLAVILFPLGYLLHALKDKDSR